MVVQVVTIHLQPYWSFSCRIWTSTTLVVKVCRGVCSNYWWSSGGGFYWRRDYPLEWGNHLPWRPHTGQVWDKTQLLRSRPEVQLQWNELLSSSSKRLWPKGPNHSLLCLQYLRVVQEDRKNHRNSVSHRAREGATKYQVANQWQFLREKQC